MSTAMSTSIEKVIDNDFCIGCGMCSAVSSQFKLGETPVGFVKVVERPTDPALLARASAVCPFGSAPDEDAIAATQFPAAVNHDEGLGSYIDLYAGYAKDFRSSGGSGGITRWLMSRLLSTGRVDFVVVVDRKLAAEDGDLFTVTIHETVDALLGHTSTSAYFPISLAGAVQMLKQREGRFAITALPCFSRALRGYAAVDPEFVGRLAYVSGVICGSLKGRRYAEYLGQQMGVAPERLDRINFRGKSLSRTANEKCVEVWSKDNRGAEPNAVARVQQLRGTDYGSGYFKPKACDYCDDVFAETADIAFGDAWISPYKDMPEGTNVVVVRSQAVADLIEEGKASGELVLDTLTPEQAVFTQASGLRHRRQGLAVRLWLAGLVGAWTPAKRVDKGRGHLPFVLSQLVRVGIRRATSLRSLRPMSQPFELVLWVLVKAHNKLRRGATKPQKPNLGRIRSM